jgi:Na+-translocating ferredoxin:NAD+ oxidoreductase RnfG subunit
MKKLFFILLSLLTICLFAETFIELNDENYLETVHSIANTDEFRAFTYMEYNFAVLEDKEDIRFFIVSTDFSEVIGYQGTTSLGIIFNLDLSVEKLEIIRSEETPGFVRRILAAGYPDRLINFKQYDEVDFVTGATMTCEAMVQSLNESIEIFRPIVEKWLNEQ